MNLTQNLISLPGQTMVIANAPASVHTGIASAVSTSVVPDGAPVNSDMAGSIISATFDTVLESVIANTVVGNDIERNINPGLLTFHFGAADVVQQYEATPVIDLLGGGQTTLQVGPVAITPAILNGDAHIPEKTPDNSKEENITLTLANSNSDIDELAAALWPWPMNTAPAAGKFIISPALAVQSDDLAAPQLTIIEAAPAVQVPAPQNTAPELTAAPLQTVTAYEAAAAYSLGDTKWNTIPISKTEAAPAPISEYRTAVPNSEANMAPRQTSASGTPIQSSLNAPQAAPMDTSGSRTAVPIAMTDEAGNETVEKSPMLSGSASETAANPQILTEPDQVTVPHTATTPPPIAAPLLAVAATPTNKQTTSSKNNQSNASAVDIAPQNRQSPTGISKRSSADIQIEAPSSGSAPNAAEPGNTSTRPVPGADSPTTSQNVPMISIASVPPQISAPVENSSMSHAGREPVSPDTVSPASEQTAPRSNTLPQNIAAAQLTPGQNSAAPYLTAADGQNFVQTMEQLSEPMSDAAPLALQPGAPDMVQAATGNTAQIDKQDALRPALTQTAPPRSETPHVPVSPPIRDIAVHILQHADNGMNRFQLRLDPPELGRVDVRMEVSSDGKLSAVIAVERPETLDLLQRDSRALEKSLAEAGLKTDSSSLSFSLKGGRHENQNADGSRPGHGAAGNLLTEDWEEPIAQMAVRFANRSVNIRI